MDDTSGGPAAPNPSATEDHHGGNSKGRSFRRGRQTSRPDGSDPTPSGHTGRRGRRIAVAAAATAAICAAMSVVGVIALAGTPPNVTTAAYNTLRTGWDPNEPALAPTDVDSGSFSKVFTTALDGAIYAQPLVIGNVVVVTTEKAMAYGVDATTGQIVWQRSFGTPFLAKTIDCGDLAPDIGSTSTPVEDPSTGIVYLTTRLQSGKGIANSHWWLQGISAATGAEAPGFPVEIQGTPVNTPGVPFNDNYSMNRTGLLLLGGVVYIAFASDCDITPYRGVIAGVSTTTHAITTMWSDEAGAGTDQNSQAGIWQSGGGLVSDGPHEIIFASGNGISPPPSPAHHPPQTLSESVVRLHVNSDGSLTPTDFFAPADAPTLDQNDEDLGAGGPVALPPAYFGTSAIPDLIVEDGKDGRVFLLNAGDLGGREQGSGGGDDTLETLGPFGGVWGHPAVFGGQGGWVYILESGGGYLRAYSYGVNGSGIPALTQAGASTGFFGYTSGSPTVTSNGTTAGSAVVWVVYASGPSGKNAQLRAYDAIPNSSGVLPLLWSGNIGVASKFSVPTAYNGRIYVGNREGDLDAFGGTQPALTATPAEFGDVPVGGRRTVSVDVTATRTVTVDGVEGVAGVESAPGGASATTTSVPAAPTTTAPTASGGPIAPAGTEPISGSGGVLRVSSAGPRRLVAGQTYTVHLTFAPRRPGSVVADLTLATSAGPRSISISGYGTAPGLLPSAAALQFGTVDTGAGGSTLTVTVSNSWDHDETITGVDEASGQFAVSGAPRPGQVLAPQQAVTIAVTYNPTSSGPADSALTVTSNHGAVTIPLLATGATGTAHLAVSTTSLAFGTVAVGSSETLTFTITNTGNIPLVITRAAAPAGDFSAPVPLPEDIALDPGTSVTQTVVFRPSGAGPESGRYLLTAANGQGPVVVGLSGTGGS